MRPLISMRVAPGRDALAGIRSVRASRDRARLPELLEGLERAFRSRRASLEPVDAPMPEVADVERWYEGQAPLREIDPARARLADEVLTLRYLLRDAGDTARRLAPGDDPWLALDLAWVMRAGELEAAVSFTERPALSCDPRMRVPYVYNVWSGAPGRGGDLLRFVAAGNGGSILLHPLHERVAAHYRRAYGAVPA